jgi:DNA-binding transcriptional ArsR family regulator
MKSILPLPEMPTLRASAAKACAILRILANEDRLLIMCELSQGPRNVGELKAILDIHQPTLSQQLTVLREEKLVTTERKGKYIYYHMASSEALKIMQTLFELYCESAKKRS